MLGFVVLTVDGVYFSEFGVFVILLCLGVVLLVAFY